MRQIYWRKRLADFRQFWLNDYSAHTAEYPNSRLPAERLEDRIVLAAPVAVPDAEMTTEDASVTVDVVANDTDSDPGDLLTVTEINGTPFDSNGTVILDADTGETVTLNADGSLTYDPGTAFDYLAPGDPSAVSTFEYTVDDGNGGTDTATVTITISAINDPVVANPDFYETDEDTALSVLDYDDTVLGDDPLVYWRFGESSGTTADNLGTLGAAADGTYNGNVILGVTGAIDNDTAIEFLGNKSTDYVSVNTLSIPSDEFAIEFWVETTVGDKTLVSYAPLNNEQNEFVIRDAASLEVYINASVIETGVNVADGQYHHVVMSWSSITDILQIYVDGTLAFSTALSTADPASMPISSGGTLIIGQKQQSQGGGLAASERFAGKLDEFAIYGNLTSTQVQAHFQARNSSGLLGNDDDPDSILTVTQVNGSVLNVGSEITLASGALLTVNSDGTLHYDPNGAFEYLAVGDTAMETFNYTASDSLTSSTATVTITIHGVNDDPEGMDQSFETTEDDTLEIQLRGALGSDALFYDVDTNDTLTYYYNGVELQDGVAVALDPLNPLSATITLDATNGVLIYDPRVEFNHLSSVGPQTAMDSFTLTAEDGSGETATATAEITITGVNDPPTANDDPGGVDPAYETDEDTAFDTGNVLSNDTDPDSSDTLSVLSFDTTGTLGQVTDNGNGTFHYNPNGMFEYLAVGESATDTFTYTVSDGHGGMDTATVTITIHGQNDQPEISVATGDSATGSVNETDAANLTTSGTLSVEDLDVTDTVSVSVDSVAVTSGSDNGIANATLLAMLSVDAGDIISSSGTSGTIHWTFDSGAETFDYLAAGESLELTYTVKTLDNSGVGSGPEADSDTQTVTITIHGQNDQPVASAIPDQTNNDSETVSPLDVSGYFSDVDDNTTLTYSLSGQPAGLSINASTGVISGTIAADASQSSPYMVTVTVDDGAGGQASDTFQWTVNNPSPVAQDDEFTTDEDTPLTGGNVLSNNGHGADTDPDGDPLTVSAVNGVAGNVGAQITLSSGALLTVHADGTFTYDPNGQFESLTVGQTAVDNFNYTVTDNLDGFDTATVSITIEGVGEQEDPLLFLKDTKSDQQQLIFYVSTVEVERKVVSFEETVQVLLQDALTETTQFIRNPRTISGTFQSNSFEVVYRIIVNDRKTGPDDEPFYEYIELSDSNDQKVADDEETIEQAKARLEQFLSLVPELPDNRYQLVLLQKHGDKVVAETVILDVIIKDGEIIEKNGASPENGVSNPGSEQLDTDHSPAAGESISTENRTGERNGEIGAGALPFLAIADFRRRRQSGSPSTSRLNQEISHTNPQRNNSVWLTLYKIGCRR